MWTKLGLKEDLIQRKCAFRLHMFPRTDENRPAVFIVRVMDDWVGFIVSLQLLWVVREVIG